MANLHLVTGYAGEEHITSNDQGSFNAALMGTGEFVLERGKQFEAQVISNNQVRIFDGDLLMQGRQQFTSSSNRSISTMDVHLFLFSMVELGHELFEDEGEKYEYMENISKAGP